MSDLSEEVTPEAEFCPASIESGSESDTAVAELIDVLPWAASLIAATRIFTGSPAVGEVFGAVPDPLEPLGPLEAAIDCP